MEFVHKITNFIIFRSTCMYGKLRNFRTIHPGAVNFILKYAQISKESCHKILRQEHCAFRRYRTNHRDRVKGNICILEIETVLLPYRIHDLDHL